MEALKMSPAKSTESLQQHSEIMLNKNNNYGTVVSEIEEEEEEEEDNIIEIDTINHQFDNNEIEEESCVYVAVGKSDTSMEALSWTLNNLFTTHNSNNTILYLIHVFPQIKHIPNPLGVGMVPRNQVSVEQVENYMEQERDKRRQLLHKFIQSCSLSKVKVDTILIESDFVAKAILDLIPILQITNLVIGTNKFNLRKSRSKKGNGGVANEILKSASESCKVRIICEGKEVNEQMMMMSSPSPSPQPQIFTVNNNTKENDSVLVCCFKPKKFKGI